MFFYCYQRNMLCLPEYMSACVCLCCLELEEEGDGNTKIEGRGKEEDDIIFFELYIQYVIFWEK